MTSDSETSHSRTGDTGSRSDTSGGTPAPEPGDGGALPGDGAPAAERGPFSDAAAEAFIRSAAEARIAELEGDNADVKDRMLRLAADMENLRRRTEREVKDARTYAVTGFAREMLAVMDNLRRAIAAVPDGARSGGDAGLATLIDGVELTERGLLAALEKFGVRRLEPEGQRFDANFHQAMFEVPNAEVPNNTVVQVVQDGYSIGERVLRPAMVGVAKGGPKGVAETRPADAAEGGAA